MGLGRDAAVVTSLKIQLKLFTKMAHWVQKCQKRKPQIMETEDVTFPALGQTMNKDMYPLRLESRTLHKTRM